MAPTRSTPGRSRSSARRSRIRSPARRHRARHRPAHRGSQGRWAPAQPVGGLQRDRSPGWTTWRPAASSTRAASGRIVRELHRAARHPDPGPAGPGPEPVGRQPAEGRSSPSGSTPLPDPAHRRADARRRRRAPSARSTRLLRRPRRARRGHRHGLLRAARGPRRSATGSSSCARAASRPSSIAPTRPRNGSWPPRDPAGG